MSNKDFAKLQKIWYKKLADSGFQEIEANNGGQLKWSSSSQSARNLARTSLVSQDNKRQYYRLAGFFLHEYAFDSQTDKFIWSKHAEGVSVRNISALLKSMGMKTYTSSASVCRIIDRLKKEMFKKYKDLDNDQE